MKPYFITFEGIEGAGKSTAIHFVKEFLLRNNIEVVGTREPGGTMIAEDIRKLLLMRRSEKICADAELLLFFAGRAQHIAQVIRPALAQGKWVLSDRFTDATYAYQGEGRNIPAQRIATLEDWVQAELRPDLTIVLDVEVDEGLARARSAGKLDRIESEELDFFTRVRNCYLERARRNSERYRIIDAMQPLFKVEQELQQCLQSILGKSSSGNI